MLRLLAVSTAWQGKHQIMTSNLKDAHLRLASAAPLPGTTSLMMTPRLPGPSTFRAVSSGTHSRPRPGRMTRPYLMIWFTTLRTVSAGMQKPTPLHAAQKGQDLQHTVSVQHMDLQAMQPGLGAKELQQGTQA